MKILLIADNYLPSKLSSAILMSNLAHELSGSGNDVTVLVPDSDLKESFLIEREGEFQVVRVKSAPIRGVSHFVRAINESMLPILIWRNARVFLSQYSAELIIFYSPSIFLGRLVGRLKKRWSCPTYLIIRDIFPQWALDAGVLKKGLAYHYFRKIELYQYKIADYIGVQSKANLDYFDNLPIELNKEPDVLHNWMVTDGLEVLCTEFRSKYGLKNKIIFFYGGNIGVAQDIDNLLKLAVSMISKESIHFLLIGEGSRFAYLKRRISELQLKNISLYQSISQEEYFGIVKEIDVGLISLDRKLTTHNIPGKALGYMYMQKPVLASVNKGNDLEKLLIQSGAGLVSVNGDDNQLLENAHKLANSRELRENMGKASRELLEVQFSVVKAASIILSHVNTSE